MKTKEENIQFLRDHVRNIYEKLTPEHIALWGRMDAQQMLEHLGLAIKVSSGKINVEVITPPDKVEKLKRIAVLSERPLPMGFQNPVLPETPIPYYFINFNEAKKALWEELDFFFDYFTREGDNHKRPHNVFGDLNYEEWLMFHYKHFMHHGAQFGLVEKTEKL